MLARLTTRFSKGAVGNKSLPLIVALVALLPGAVVFAQQVDGDFEGETEYVDKDGNSREITEPNSKVRRKMNDLFSQGKTSNKEDEQVFEDYCHYYVYALTWKKNLTKVAEKRKDLKNKCLVPAGQRNRTVTDLHRRANELALATFKKVAGDVRYPRAIRYNCILSIGELDAEEAQPGVAPAVPLPDATAALLEVAGDVKQPLLIRIGAVLTLKRPLQLGVTAELQTQASGVLLGVVQKAVAEGNDQAGQAWLRWAVADLLHAMMERKIAVDQPKLATALAGHIADEKLPTWARAKLAGVLGRLDGRAMPAGQLGPTVRSLASLMLAITQASPFAQDEEAEADGEKNDADTKGAEKNGSEKNDDTHAAPEVASPTVQKLSSEETIWQLSQIRLALFGKDAPVGKADGPSDSQGLQMAADDASKAAMKKIVGRIDELVKLLAGVPNNLPKLAETLRGANDDLQDILSSAAAGQAQTAKNKKAGTAPGAPPKGNAPAGASAVTP